MGDRSAGALTSTGSGPPLALTDLRSGTRWRLPWPSRIGLTDLAAVQPDGGLIALDFADPGYAGTQVTDVWLLDPATRRFRHLPDMPAAVHLKFTSMAWASHGRLVILAQTDGPSGDRNVVAIWKPGQRQIALRPLRLPGTQQRQRHVRHLVAGSATLRGRASGRGRCRP